MSLQDIDHHSANDLDARIAAERQAASLYVDATPEVSAATTYGGESRLAYFIQSFKANPKLAIPLIVAPILLLSLVVGFAAGGNSSQQVADNKGLNQIDTDTGPHPDTADPVTVDNDASARLVTSDSATLVVDSSSTSSNELIVSDQDKDGVADDVDRCRATAGPASNAGCPVAPTSTGDQDKDGVADGADACPQVAGPRDNAGCPNTKPPVNNDADPGNDDQDEDGVPDRTDACPTEAGTSSNGCPVVAAPKDRDNDGVADAKDKCPTVKGLASNNGCPAPTTAKPTKITKILTVVIENHSYSQMLAGMPTTVALGKKYGYTTQFYGKTHPSLPNYITIAAGSTMGVKNDGDPSKWKLKGQTIFGQAVAVGKTAKIYSEGMTGNCTQKKKGGYVVKHNPWAYFVDPAERKACNSGSVSFSSFAADAAANKLPNVGMVVPTGKNNGHDGSLQTADTWIRKNVWEKVVNTDDFKSGKLAVIITADEDDKKHNNNILTVIATKSLENKHKVISQKFNHPSLTRLYAELLKVTPLREGKTAPSLMTAFNLPL